MPTNVLTDTLNIRESDVDYEIEIELTAGLLVKYSKEDDCGDSTHVTVKSHKRFEHLHVKYTLPKNGKVVRKRTGSDWEDVKEDTTKMVTTDNVNAYWDHQFNGYTRTSGADIVCNCIGYARGYYNTWIEPTDNDARSIIEADDYEDTCVYAAGNLERGSTHDIVIVEVYEESGDKIKKTRETNGQGGVYEKTYDSPGRECKMGYKMVKRKA